MSTKIHFYSGKTVELSDKEGPAFWDRLRNAGMRYWISKEQGVTIIFNSATIEYIETDLMDNRTVGEIEAAKQAQAKAELDERKESDTLTQEDEERIKEAAMKKAEQDFMDKSNCKHKTADGDTLYELHYNETTTGRKYFPVCSFCGHRARYVGLQKVQEGKSEWTTDDIEFAKPYEA